MAAFAASTPRLRKRAAFSFSLLTNLLGLDSDSIFHTDCWWFCDGFVVVAPSQVVVLVLPASTGALAGVLYDLLHHGIPPWKVHLNL
jgi:hypothetical protein